MIWKIFSTIFILYSPLAFAIDLVIDLADNSLNRELEKAFKDKNIPYKLNDKGVFHYPEQYYPVAQKLLNTLVLQNSPPSERSISYYDQETLDFFVHELEVRNVPYTKKLYSDSVWVIWELGHEFEVEESKSKANQFFRTKIIRQYEK